MSMKVVFEKIELVFGSFFMLRSFDEFDDCNYFNWYFYLEYEIVYIFRGKGKWYIGDYIFYFEFGDLIFLGFNFFYFGFMEEVFEVYMEIVV